MDRTAGQDLGPGLLTPAHSPLSKWLRDPHACLGRSAPKSDKLWVRVLTAPLEGGPPRPLFCVTVPSCLDHPSFLLVSEAPPPSCQSREVGCGSQGTLPRDFGRKLLEQGQPRMGTATFEPFHLRLAVRLTQISKGTTGQ